MAHILVIDDEPSLRFVIMRTLAKLGHDVREAGNGRVALDLLRAKPADLVLTDLVMPEQDGIETIMALRHVFPAMPVIAMSGAPSNAALYLEIAKRLGVRQTLAKPFEPDTLIAAIDNALECARAA